MILKNVTSPINNKRFKLYRKSAIPLGVAFFFTQICKLWGLYSRNSRIVYVQYSSLSGGEKQPSFCCEIDLS